MGHFSVLGAHLHQVHVSRFDPKVPHFSRKFPPVAAKRKRDTQDQERVSLPSAHCALRTARVHPGSLMGVT